MIMRHLIISLLSIQFAFTSFAQQATNDLLQKKTDTVSSSWSFAADAYYYVFPGEKNTATLLGYADHKSLHLEARYNYEDRKTGSIFGGYMFETGNKLVLTLTPMIGFVFGNTNGIAPGLEASLSWKKLDFYSETEFVVDFDGEENNFLYTWIELAKFQNWNFRQPHTAVSIRP
jgi:hypothetical protein